MFELTLQALYSGVLAGSSYALIALGLALVFGTMRIINLAHGEMVLLSAYMAYTLESGFSLNPIASIPIAVAVVCVLSLTINQLVNHIRHDRELNSLILTFGIGIIVTNAITGIWSADIRSTKSVWLQDSISLGPLYSMKSEVLFFVISLVLIAGVWWWLNKSWYGRAIRAVSSNREAAKLMGINPQYIEGVSFLVAGVLAGFAGVALYCNGVIQPPLGGALTVKAFIITVLAGMGSIAGVLVGALLIGIVETLTTTFYSSSVQDLTAMVLFLVVLLVSPNGLFGAVRRRG
ncbi:MAG: branched-chain amino acid ABC transporter permease [Betaproteobacteria bacterium]|nr:branched-chain amino acid ABC transporter permease [Betaproteobacteria bacterium]